MLSQLVTSLCIFTALGAASAHAQSVKDRPSVPTEMREQVQNTYIVTFEAGQGSGPSTGSEGPNSLFVAPSRRS